MKTILQRPIFWFILALLLAAGFKLWLVSGDRVPFNADEAIVALMGRHILQGERPAFFYGQAYMGSLDAWLAAAGFAMFGQHVWVIRLIQSLLYLATLATTGWLGRRIFGNWAVGALAMLLLAIPPVNVSLYTTASLGGYGEALLIGNLILLVGFGIVEDVRRQNSPASRWRWGVIGRWFALGFLGGVGLWSFGLALAYAVPVGAWLLWRTWQSIRRPDGAGPWAAAWAVLLAGAGLGALPWLLYAGRHGLGALLVELGGGAIAGAERLPWIFSVAQHAFGFLLLGVSVTFGFRPPWSAQWLALPLLPVMLLVWMGVLGHMARSFQPGRSRRLLPGLAVGVMGVLVMAFILTPFGADPSGRYFVPLSILLALFAAQAFLQWSRAPARQEVPPPPLPEEQSHLSQPALASRGPARWSQQPWLAVGLAVLMIGFQLWGNVQTGLRIPPGVTTQFYAPSQVDMRAMDELIAFLKQKGELRGYTNYWVAYPLAFLSQEEIIFTPRLPYHLDFRHTERDNRYAPYNQVVAEAGRVAYITTHHPELDERLRLAFRTQGITWEEAQIGDFHIFYQLSQPVRIEQTGFGVNNNP